VKVTRHKNIAGVGHDTLVSAGFFELLLCSFALIHKPTYSPLRDFAIVVSATGLLSILSSFKFGIFVLRYEVY